MKVKLLLLLLLAATRLQAQVVDDGLQYVPFAAAVGLDFCGVEARHPLRERIALAATAYTALTGVAGGLKLTVSEWRPDDSDDRSFPQVTPPVPSRELNWSVRNMDGRGALPPMPWRRASACYALLATTTTSTTCWLELPSACSRPVWPTGCYP